MSIRLISRAILFGPMILSLPGCTSPEQWIAENCNADAAYADGVNDATEDIYMNPNFAKNCLSNQAFMNASYKRGYQFGLSRRRQHPHHPY